MHTEELWYGFDDRLGIEVYSFQEGKDADMLY